VALSVIDAGVVIEFLDRTDAHHEAAVAHLAERRHSPPATFWTPPPS
jgi:predicted nucleic acid-binding protein